MGSNSFIPSINLFFRRFIAPKGAGANKKASGLEAPTTDRDALNHFSVRAQS